VTGDDGGEQRFAPTYWRVLYGISSCGLTAFPMVLLAFAVSAPWNLLLGVGAAISLVLGIRQSSQIALIVDDDGVTVKNFVRTYRLGWSEIAAVELDVVYALARARKHCVAFRRHRRDVTVDAYATISDKTRRPALRALEPLAKRWNVRFDVPPAASAER